MAWQYTLPHTPAEPDALRQKKRTILTKSKRMPLKELLTKQLEAALTLPEGNQFQFLIALTRCILQHAAISALEYCASELDDDDADLISCARQLLTPADGTPLEVLDRTIPLIRNSGWGACAVAWFESISAPKNKGDTPSLSRRVESWVRFRNDRPGHGVVDEATVRNALTWMPDLAASLINGLSDLLPTSTPGKNDLELETPERRISIKTLRLINNDALVIRSITRKGSAWRVKHQTLHTQKSREDTYEIGESGPLISLLGNRPRLYQSTHRRIGNSDWRPTVLLPQRQTTTFKGRSEQLKELAEWYNNTDSRACLIYGEGGIGKTTLALEFLNEVLENPPSETKWKPSIISFYSAKQTRWGPDGLEFLRGISPAVGDSIRQLVLVLEEKLDKKWYEAELLTLVDRAATLFSEAGVKRDDILLVIDNTETLARNPGEEEELTRVFSRIAGRLCRLLMTSRRRERVEAYPIQVLPMDEETSHSLLRELGHVYNAQPLLAAGDARLRKVGRQLSGRPILLDVFARHASRAGRSIDEALQLVLREAREDLGEFLFQDAWQRIGPEQREVFLVLGRLGGTVDGQAVGWVCSDIGIPHSVWQDAFDQTRFGSLVDYGTRYDVQLEVGMNEFLARKYQNLQPTDQQRVDKTAQAVSRRYRQLLTASEANVTDRVIQAFRSSAAKAAKLAGSAGNTEDAILWYEEAVRVDAGNAALWDRYSWYLMIKVRDLARARECASEACRLAPNDPEAHFTAGMIAARLRDVIEADRLLIRAEQKGKLKHLCLVQRARARIEAASDESNKKPQAHLKEAEQLLTQALQAPPETKRRTELISECNKLMNRVRILKRARKVVSKPLVTIARKNPQSNKTEDE